MAWGRALQRFRHLDFESTLELYAQVNGISVGWQTQSTAASDGPVFWHTDNDAVLA